MELRMAAKKTPAKVSALTKKASPAQAKPRPVVPNKVVANVVGAAKAAPAKKAVLTKVPAAASAGLGEGDKAPMFSLPDESGAVLSSTSLVGKPYVIYFYPKDDTPGCSKEACDFRDNLRSFNAAKVRVLGVSPDDSRRHSKFKEKYALNFSLLSDVEKTLIGAYGIWIEKSNYGKRYMGVQRSTFLVDKSGKIAKAWYGVRVPGHVEAVLAAL